MIKDNQNLLKNKEYSHFVVDMDNMIVCTGWSYKEDAMDMLADLKEWDDIAYKVYTRKYLETKIKGA